MQKNNYCHINIPKETSKKDNLPKKLKQYLTELNNADGLNEEKEYKTKIHYYWEILSKLKSTKDKAIFLLPEVKESIDELIIRLRNEIKKEKLMAKTTNGIASLFIHCWYILIYIDTIKPIENELILEYLTPIFKKMKWGHSLLFYGIHKMKSMKNLVNEEGFITKQIVYYISFELLTSQNKIKFEINTLYSLIKNENLFNRHYYEFLFNLCYLNLIEIKQETVNNMTKETKECEKETTTDCENEEKKKEYKRKIKRKLYKLMCFIYFKLHPIPQYCHRKMIIATLFEEHGKLYSKLFNDLKLQPRLKEIFDRELILFLKNDDTLNNQITQEQDSKSIVFEEFHLNMTTLNIMLYYQSKHMTIFMKKMDDLKQKINKKNSYLNEDKTITYLCGQALDFVWQLMLLDNSNYSPQTKNYIRSILRVLTEFKENGNVSPTILKFLTEKLIPNYGKYFDVEWDQIIQILKGTNQCSWEFLETLLHLALNNEYKGKNTTLNKLLEDWTKHNNTKFPQQLDNQFMYLKHNFSSETQLLKRLDKTINTIEQYLKTHKEQQTHKEQLLPIWEKIYQYIYHYYIKNTHNEIFIHNLESILSTVLPKILSIHFTYHIPTEYADKQTITFLALTNNIEFFNNVILNLFREISNDKQYPVIFLSQTILENKDINQSVVKLQAIADRITDIFNNNDYSEYNKLVDEMIQQITKYYVSANYKVYINKKCIIEEEEEEKKMEIDNKKNRLKDSSVAVLNLTNLFHYIVQFLNSNKSNENSIKERMIYLCSIQMSKRFFFFRNADIEELIKKILLSFQRRNEQKITLQDSFIANFLANLSYHLHCSFEIPNPFEGNVIKDKKYDLLENSICCSLKQLIITYLKNQFNEVIENEKKKIKRKMQTDKPDGQKTHKVLSHGDFILKVLSLLEIYIFSLYNYEKENSIIKNLPLTNLFQIVPKSVPEIEILKNDVEKLLRDIFIMFFELRNILGSEDYLIGYALLNFIYTNKEIICHFENIIEYAFIFLLCLDFPEKVGDINKIVNGNSFKLRFITKPEILKNSYHFDIVFKLSCDQLLNYFEEQTPKGNELIDCFQTLFKPKIITNDGKPKFEINPRNDCLIECLKWNLSSKNLRNSLNNVKKDTKDFLTYIDGMNIITIYYNALCPRLFDVDIRTPISNVSFSIERESEATKPMDKEKTYSILNKMINGEEEEEFEEEKIEENQEQSPQSIEEIIENNSFLFQKIYKFNSKDSIKIPTKTFPERMSILEELDSISVYRTYQCNIHFKSDKKEKYTNQFISFINSLGNIVSDENDIKNNLLKIQYQDINNAIFFNIPIDNSLKIEQEPSKSSNLLYSNVTLIWRNNAYDKIEELNTIATIVIIPYCSSHHRVQIKIKKDYQHRKKINDVFLKNIFIYTGEQYEILSNYIVKLIIKLNLMISALKSRAEIVETKDDNIMYLKKYENMYKRYYLIDKYRTTREENKTIQPKPTVQNSIKE